MKPIKNFWCDCTPKDAEIYEAMHVAQTEHCVVMLHWFVSYNGWFKRVIKEDSSFEDIKKSLPRIYGM